MPSVAGHHRRGDTTRVSRRDVGAARREGIADVSEVQRARMLSSAVRVVSELGYQKMSVARIAGGARVSRRTFYDVFEDREDCFLAIFEDALGSATERVSGAYDSADGGDDWCEPVRAALTELLVFFDEEPRAASLLVVDALGAGQRVLERRAQVLKRLSARLHEDGSRAGSAKQIAPLTGEGVVGAVFSVIHTRISQKDPGTMLELLNPLMGMIVLPYLGRGAAQREQRGTRTVSPDRKKPAGLKRPTRSADPAKDPLAGLPMRITYRTLRVLGASAENPGASNRTIGEASDIYDQGQISKLLARLEGIGLIENTTDNGHRPTGEPNAWRLTARGEEVERAVRVRPDDDDPRGGGEHKRSHR